MHRVANPAKPKGCGGSIPPDTATKSFPLRSPALYPAPMSEPGPTYQVSIIERQPSGQNLIRILLRTENLEEANALVNSLEQDGVKPRFEVIRPARKKR
jgi:hypothetical protein